MTAKGSQRGLVAILAVLLGWHLATLPRQTLFVDEVGEIRFTELAFGELVLLADSMPPLYPMLHKLIREVSPHEMTGRWFSALCGMLTVVVVWAWMQQLATEASAFAAAAWVAVLPLGMYYSEFTRVYALVSLLVAVQLWSLAKAQRSDRARWLAVFAAATVLGMYAHYYFGLFAAAVALPAFASGNKLFRWRLAGTLAVVALLCVPTIFLLKQDLEFQKSLRQARQVNLMTLGYTYFSIIGGYSLGVSRAELQTIGGAAALKQMAGWLLAVAATTIPLFAVGCYALRKQRMLTQVIVLLFAPTTMLLVVCSLLHLNFNTRHLSWLVVPTAAVLGAGCTQRPRSLLLGGCSLGLVAIVLVANANRQFAAKYQTEDIRSAMQFVESSRIEGEPLLVVSGYLASVAEHYQSDREQPRPQSFPFADKTSFVVDSQTTRQQLFDRLQAATGGDSYWLIYSRPFHGDPEGLVLKAFAEAGQFEKQADFAGVVVYRGQASVPPDQEE